MQIFTSCNAYGLKTLKRHLNKNSGKLPSNLLPHQILSLQTQWRQYTTQGFDSKQISLYRYLTSPPTTTGLWTNMGYALFLVITRGI